LPMNITFANSIGVLCDEYGADAKAVMKGLGLDHRIGPDFLGVGLGYGGSCFPKDVSALIKLAQQKNYNFRILKAVEKSNENQLDFFLDKVTKACGGSVKNKIIVILGLAFKPGTSDMREARSIYLISSLKARGARVRVCDPVALEEAKKVIKGAKYFRDPYRALDGADALFLVTEWEEYKNLRFKKIKKIMRRPIVVDGRNVYNRKQLEKLGFVYYGIGI